MTVYLASDHAGFTRIAHQQFAPHLLRAHAAQLALAGKTSLAEAMRVCNQT